MRRRKHGSHPYRLMRRHTKCTVRPDAVQGGWDRVRPCCCDVWLHKGFKRTAKLDRSGMHGADSTHDPSNPSCAPHVTE